MSLKHITSNAIIKKQRGFLLPLALFIMLVVATMAVMLTKKLAQTSDSYIIDGLSIQAFYAAETGGQLAMHELFFADTQRLSVDGRCVAMSISQTLSGVGLNNCTITVSCNCVYEDNTSCDITDADNYSGAAGVINSFYTINSRSQCGVGNTISQHHIEIGAGL